MKNIVKYVGLNSKKGRKILALDVTAAGDGCIATV